MFGEIFDKYHILQEDTIVVACSGGPDSMYLLEGLRRSSSHPHMIVAHVIHEGFRDTIQDDYRVVQSYCAQHNLPLETTLISVTGAKSMHKTSVENACRIERRVFFDHIRGLYSAKYIFTAHHLDDQIETLMYRIVRGTKLAGLTAIKENEGYFLRPLLHTTKATILVWLEANDVAYAHDPSNDDDAYLRNHIRTNIIPHFSKINPKYSTSFESLIAYFQSMKSWIDDLFLDAIRDRRFTVKYYTSLPVFLQTELIRAIYASLNHGTIGLSEANIAEVQRFVRGEHGNKTKQIGKMYLYKSHGIIRWD